MEHFSWFSHFNLIQYDHILGSILTLAILAIAGIKLKNKLSSDNSVLPDSYLSMNNFFEILGLDFLFDIFENIFGSKEKAKKFFPLLGGAFFFILFLNLLGMIPGFLPPTGSLNTTLAFSALIFVMYNYYGIKEHGASYIKQFLGPIIWLAPLILIIELIGHVVRPVSLSLRLLMNITGDHMVLSLFTNLTHVIIPVMFVGLGIFVSFLQAFIFTVLSAIYIALAESHSH